MSGLSFQNLSSIAMDKTAASRSVRWQMSEHVPAFTAVGCKQGLAVLDITLCSALEAGLSRAPSAARLCKVTPEDDCFVAYMCASCLSNL